MAAFARAAGATDGIEQAVADYGQDQSDAGANGEGQQSAGKLPLISPYCKYKYKALPKIILRASAQ